MSKVTHLKLANSIRIGNGEETYLTFDKFDMLLDGVMVHVRCKKTQDEVTTSVFNTIWMKLEKKQNEQKTSKKGATGTSEA